MLLFRIQAFKIFLEAKTSEWVPQWLISGEETAWGGRNLKISFIPQSLTTIGTGSFTKQPGKHYLTRLYISGPQSFQLGGPAGGEGMVSCEHVRQHPLLIKIELRKPVPAAHANGASCTSVWHSHNWSFVHQRRATTAHANGASAQGPASAVCTNGVLCVSVSTQPFYKWYITHSSAYHSGKWSCAHMLSPHLRSPVLNRPWPILGHGPGFGDHCFTWSESDEWSDFKCLNASASFLPKCFMNYSAVMVGHCYIMENMIYYSVSSIMSL